ncbi:MAG TPA: hypothetical protein PLP37_11035 [Clostridiales bacterium]|nr:hypothetical protein [Clostridiales bacterium]
MEEFYYKINEPSKISMCAEQTVKYGADDSDKMMKTIDFIVKFIKSRYPFMGINLKKDENYEHYELVFDNHKTFYSYDFTVLLGKIDYLYLMPNKLNNVFFTLDYSSEKKENDYDETYVCDYITTSNYELSSNEDSGLEIEYVENNFKFNNLAA